MSSPSGEATETTEISKGVYRQQIWKLLELNKLATFPRPAYGRIPNFKGSDEAAAKLQEIEEFNRAISVEVNPDKAQEAARILALEQGKQLYVPVPRLKDGLLKHIVLQENAQPKDIKAAISRRGIEHLGQTVDLTKPVKIDFFVMGSVAVSVDGYRIGKGKGYADLEFALLKEMRCIDDGTVIATIVHDSQVFDALPSELFKAHDVPLDYILTPTRIIKVSKPSPRPTGIIWELLSARRVALMPMLQDLKASLEEKGVVITLKPDDSDVESYEPRRRFFRRFRKRRPQSEVRKIEGQEGEEPEKSSPKRNKYRRRRENMENEPESASDPNMNASRERRSYRRHKNSKNHIDFSLLVSNIEKTMRVRELKNALCERGIKPNEITWRGYKGFCYLHYAKPKPVRSSSEDEPVKPSSPVVVGDVIEILQQLKIKPESNNLNVKVLDSISRIETTDVTAV